MNSLDLSTSDRCIVVSVLLVSILAIMFPVKEAVWWVDGRWSRWDAEFMTADYRIAPYAEVGPLGRGFMLDERQRRFGEGDPPEWIYFKEQPNRMRIAFDLFFAVLLGLCAKYVMRGRLRQPVETHGSS